MEVIDAVGAEPSVSDRVSQSPVGKHAAPAPPTGIRNVALVGHNGSGKTTLAEALLFATGAITRQGRVDDGSTVSDFEPEEIKHHMSLSLALAPCTVGDVKLNIIDTPGYADFFGEVRAACSVVDLVVVVVSAVEGVEAQTEAAWDLAAELGLPRLVFVNKLDRERASFDRTLGRAPGALRRRHRPAGAADGRGSRPPGHRRPAHRHRHHLREREAPARTHPRATWPPPSTRCASSWSRGSWSVTTSSWSATSKGTSPRAPSSRRPWPPGWPRAWCSRWCAARPPPASGIDRLASLLAEIAPAPDARPPVEVRAGDTVQEVPCDPAGQPLARVFKTISDPYVGKISLLRVLSGTIRPDTVLTNSRTHSDERLHVLAAAAGQGGRTASTRPRPGTSWPCPSWPTSPPATPWPPRGPRWPSRPRPPSRSALSVAIRPKSKGDEDKLMTGLHRLQEEDPALVVERVDETHQTILRGTGETHLAVAVERLARKFGVEVVDRGGAHPLSRDDHHAGRGGGQVQEADRWSRPVRRGVDPHRAPRARARVSDFVDQVVGGAIPRQYIPAVEKGVIEAMGHGGVYGYPVVDVQVTCLDGKHHAVDSSEMSFKMAGSLAFKEAMAKAGPVLLEPISLLEVTVPATMQGHVLGDLNSRRGRVQGTDTLDGGVQMITALVPTAEIQRYAVDLRSLTGGRGRFRAEHDHYDAMPPNLVDRMARTNAQ